MKNKKVWVGIILGVLVAVTIVMRCFDPVVLDIVEDLDRTAFNDSTGYICTRIGDETIYLKDHSDLWDYEVVYANRCSESLHEALVEGNIELEDLDKFGIEYGVLPEG